MNYTRIGNGIITKVSGNFNLFLSNPGFLFLCDRLACAIIGKKGGIGMAQYELVREIQNLCPNNQMRDIFFEEVETSDPVAYIRDLLKVTSLSADPHADGSVTVYASTDGFTQKFIFTPI